MEAKKYENMTLKILPGWFFGGVNSKQFDALLIRAVKEKKTLGITNNSYCTPVYMPDFCKELEKIIFANNIDFCYSKIGILIEEKTIVYGAIQTEDFKLPLSIKCWGVWCGEKIEHWRSEDIIKIGEE